jgi:hypothetical protein
MERMKRLMDDHPDAAAFLTFVLWIVLVYIGLTAFVNQSDIADIVVYFFIIMGAVGIIYVGKTIIDVLGKPDDANKGGDRVDQPLAAAHFCRSLSIAS